LEQAGIPPVIVAFFRNQQRWLERLSAGAASPTLPHPRIRHDQSVTTVCTGRSAVMSLDVTDGAALEDLAAIERSWQWVRSRGRHDLLVWSMTDRPAMTLALFARGFEPSFRPAWMSRQLTGDIPNASLMHVAIRPATASDIAELAETVAIPYLVPEQVQSTRMLALAPAQRAVWWLIARDHAGVVGQAIVNLTDSVAGLFNVAVHPRARRQGVGRALTTRAMEIAREHGASVMGLNSTPDGLGLYTGLGFQHMGDGLTWFLPARRSRLVPDPAVIGIAEAIGRGQRDGLSGVSLPAHLPNGDLPIQFAARFGQRDMVRWLLELGAEPDVLALWDVGMHDEAARAMRSSVLLERPAGPYRATPLHHAIERDDARLADLLLYAGADLSVRDSHFRATPLEWAEYLGRDAIARMIRETARR